MQYRVPGSHPHSHSFEREQNVTFTVTFHSFGKKNQVVSDLALRLARLLYHSFGEKKFEIEYGHGRVLYSPEGEGGSISFRSKGTPHS